MNVYAAVTHEGAVAMSSRQESPGITLSSSRRPSFPSSTHEGNLFFLQLKPYVKGKNSRCED